MIKNEYKYISIENMDFKDFNKSKNIKNIYVNGEDLINYIDIINIVIKEIVDENNIYSYREDKNIDACLDLASDIFVYGDIPREVGVQIFIKNLEKSSLNIEFLIKIFKQMCLTSQNLHRLYELEVDRSLDIYIFKDDINFDSFDKEISKRYEY